MPSPPPDHTVPGEALLTSAQLQARLQVCERTLDNLLLRGLPCIKVGRARRFDYAAVMAHLQSQQAAKSPTAPRRGRPPRLGLLARARQVAPKT